MKTLIGGAIAAALGLVGIAVWWCQFLEVLAGTIPVILLLGGALAIYLGFDELKENWRKDEPSAAAGEDVEKYQQEISELKEEIESLKKE